MKIHIFFPFDKYGGGGNQFLKALKGEFIRMGVYEPDPLLADSVLYNSHHDIIELLKIKYKYPQKKYIHRIDGPVFLIRGRALEVDRSIFLACDYIASAVIYQSKWSMKKIRSLE